MNSPTISAEMSSSALEVLAIARSSAVFRPLIEEHADFRELLVRAADAAATGPYRVRLIEALTLATTAGDKAVEVMCIGDAAELGKWRRIHALACEDLGRLLKQLVPAMVPIGEEVSSAPN